MSLRTVLRLAAEPRLPALSVLCLVCLALTITAAPVSAQPDLIATKTNDTSSVGVVGTPFTWTIKVDNIGSSDYFIAGSFDLLRDELPNTNITYGSPNITAQSGVTGTIVCRLSNFRLSCDGFTNVTIAAGGSFTVAVTATPSAAGTFDNPRSGQICRADPGNEDSESNESNNDCSDSVVVGTGVTGPDLTVVKNNDVGDATELANGAWDWSLQVANGGDADATFSNGQVILRDDLPASGLTYGTPSLPGQTGISGSGSIACAIATNTLTCSANGGNVTLAAPNGAFTVTVPTTPTATGSYANPRAAGTCAADPDGLISEGDESNNACSNTVVVAGSPDLTAVKTNDVADNAVISTPFNWSITVTNGGSADYFGPSSFSLLRDELPSTNVSYGTPTISAQSGITGSFSPSITSNSGLFRLNVEANSNVTIAPGGSFTVTFAATPTAAGVLDNPRSGQLCRADPGNEDAELDESNNDCSNSVTVGTGITGPDLTVVKNNDVGDATELADGAWNWSLLVANGGDSDATFSSGQVILRDDLPASDLSYGTPTLSGQTGLSGSGTVACAIATNTLTCSASGGDVTLSSSAGGFTVNIATTPSATGTFDNPRAAGSCAVDPAGVVTEGDESNNTCSDSVVVAGSPDLVASKSNDTAGIGTVGVAFDWSITVTNNGSADYFIASSFDLLRDELPDSDITYGSPSVSGQSGVTGTFGCQIQSFRLSCEANTNVTIAPGGGFTVTFAATPTAEGVFANPRSGELCRADPGNEDAELDESNNDCSDTVTLTALAELELTKSDSPDPVIAGNDLSFSLTARNAGPSTADSVVLYDLLPAGIAFDGPASDSRCTQPAGLVGLTASLDGSQTTPMSGSAATGLASLVLDTTSNELRFALAASGISGTLTGASLRLADGTLVQSLYGGAPPTFDDSSPITGRIQLTQAQADALQVANSYRLRIDTSANPAGEIAGTPAVASAMPVVCALGSLAASADTSVSLVAGVASNGAGQSLDNLAFVTSATEEPNEASLPAGELRGAAAVTGTTVTAATDLALTKADSADPAIAGQNLTYTLTVTNNGPSDSSGATISDPLPAGTTFVSSPDGCGEAGGTVTCPVGALASGASTSVAFTVTIGASVTGSLSNTATVTANESDPTSGNDSATEATAVTASADLALSKDDDLGTAVAGGEIGYLLAVTNNGPSDATGVVVGDPLPAGTSFASSTDGCTEAGGIVSCPVGALAAGASRTVTFRVAVDPGIESSITNQAVVSGNENDPVSSNDESSVITPVEQRADLRLDKASSVDPVVAGQELTYTLTVTNDGPSTSDGATVSDPLPAGTSFVSSPDGCGDAAGTVTCAIGSLAPGASQSVPFTVQVEASTVGPLINRATVTGVETDPDNSNDTAEITTTVSRQADLEITQVDNPDPVTAGNPLSYTLTVANVGPSDDLETVTVGDTLPAGTTFQSASGTGWSCGQAAGVVTCSRAGLAVGNAPPITVAVTVDPDTTGSLTNTVSVTSSTTDPDPGADDTNVVESTTVATEADLSLSKSDSVDPVPGNTFSYTLEVTNAGPSEARNVIATDTLPTGLVFDSSATCTEAAGVVTCDFGTIAAGATEALEFVVTLSSPPDSTVLNTASVTSDDPDPNSADNSDQEETSLDLEAPTVSVLSSVGDTGDGSLDECETATVAIDRLRITFSEAMADPTGDSDPQDVTNPDNYRLLAAGADRSFDTVACGPATGDDLWLSPVSVSYDDNTLTAEVSYGTALGDDLYRLLACSTLTDPAGNALDGDADGNGGDDFARGFRIDTGNRFANGHFDCDLAGWTLTSTNPAEIAWSADDFEGSDQSGSAAISNLTASSEFQIGQCVELAAAGAVHQLRARLRLAVAPTTVLGVARGCAFFEGNGCSGTLLDSSVAAAIAEDSAGNWLEVSSEVTPPTAARSAQCTVLLSTPAGDAFDANLDFLSLRVDSTVIFADGFESGDTSRWSATVGGAP
ncbi:MAG: CHRD domain-containing protein [Acidobacteriota bacterium]